MEEPRPLFEVPDAVSTVCVKQWYDSEGYFVMCLDVVTEHGEDEEWGRFMSFVREFLRWVARHRVKYKFIFDLTKLNIWPVNQLHELMQYIKKKQHIIDEYLHSTTIRMRPGLMETIIRGVFLVFPPRRPLHIECVP